MKNKTKIIANYLPQYHEIPENDLWWGKGYTDWNATRNAVSLCKGHMQPRVPLNKRYYDLSKIETIRKQAALAKRYGIYGFGIYHYWFSSKCQLLQKPAELLLGDNSIDIHYMFIWDNASWKQTWSNVKQAANDWAPLYEQSGQKHEGNGILAQLEYGDQDEWEKHFLYLLPFFRDNRYIRDSFGRPVFMVFNMNNDSKTLKRMGEYWNQRAIQEGLNGICMLGKVNYEHISIFDYDVDYEPEQHGWAYLNLPKKILSKLKYDYEKRTNKLHIIDYDKVWKRILKDAKKDTSLKKLYSGFVRYDDSPRRGKNGRICLNSSPQKFQKYFSQLLDIANKKNKPFIFLTAWNEWGEGAYLEPDENTKYEYLEALYKATKQAYY